MEGDNKGKRGFQKGNNLWAKGLEVRKELQQKKVDMLLDCVAEGGVARFVDLMGQLAQGNPIKPAQKEFMENYLKLLPYKAPKLSSVEQRVTLDISPFGLGHAELANMASTKAITDVTPIEDEPEWLQP